MRSCLFLLILTLICCGSLSVPLYGEVYSLWPFSGSGSSAETLSGAEPRNFWKEKIRVNGTAMELEIFLLERTLKDVAGSLRKDSGRKQNVMFIWVVTLRKMLRRKMRELAESIRERETTRIEADASRRERLRLAADLHDGFQQYLAGAMFRLKAARNYLPKEAVKSAEQLEKVHEALQHTQNGLRSTLWAMNEESEGPESLMGLFAFVARRMPHWEGIVEIKSEGEERAVARNYCGSLLLVVQEAVANAIHHGKATKVEVLIHFSEDEIVLSVVDNGTGFDVEEVSSLSGHYGLKTMERRIGELGGTMKIESSPGAGTRVIMRI